MDLGYLVHSKFLATFIYIFFIVNLQGNRNCEDQKVSEVGLASYFSDLYLKKGCAGHFSLNRTRFVHTMKNTCNLLMDNVLNSEKKLTWMGKYFGLDTVKDTSKMSFLNLQNLLTFLINPTNVGKYFRLNQIKHTKIDFLDYLQNVKTFSINFKLMDKYSWLHVIGNDLTSKGSMFLKMLTGSEIKDSSTSYIMALSWLVVFLVICYIRCLEDKINNHQQSVRVSLNWYNMKALLSTMLNIKGERTVYSYMGSNNDYNYEWIFKWIVQSPLAKFLQKASVYLGFAETDLGRLASFSQLQHREPLSVLFIKLSAAGFRYTGKDKFISCVGCGSTMGIESIRSSATNQKYHRQGCTFIEMNNPDDDNDQPVRFSDYPSHSAEAMHDAAAGPFLYETLCPSLPDSTKSDDIFCDGEDSTENFEKLERSFFSSEQCQIGSLDDILSNDNRSLRGDKHLSTVISNESRLGTLEQKSAAGTLRPPKQNQSSDASHTIEVSSACIEVSSACIEDPQCLSSGYHSLQQYSTPGLFHTQSQLSGTNTLQNTVFGERLPSSVSKTLPAEPSGAATNLTALPAELSVAATNSTALPAQLCTNSTASTSQTRSHLETIESADFKSEVEHSESSDALTSNSTCKKNPGHYSNYRIDTLQLDCLPSSVRHSNFKRIIELLANLVVRVVIHSSRCSTNICLGTGFAVDKPEPKYAVLLEPVHSKVNTLRKYLHCRRKAGYVYIEINKHLFLADEDAQNTIVEFHYDRPDRQAVVKVKGVSVHHSPLEHDQKSVLVCRTHNLALINMVKESRQQIETLFQDLPANIKDGVTKRVFCISHPHGREKVFTFGEYVMIKYRRQQVVENRETTTQLVKINNQTQITQAADQLRKLILHTADTCCGSTGAVLITAKKIGTGDSAHMVLDLWMHAGVLEKQGLNVSALREVTEEDIASHGQQNPRPSYQDEMASEADRAANQVVSCPVFTVTQSPAYPVYAPYIKRLESYPASFAHVHTPSNLANAGFFFAGYGDCVRCFHCGLGLRSWRPGDEIHTEHLKNRPDCQFLLLKLKESGMDALGFDLRTRDSSLNRGLAQTEQKTSELRPAAGEPCLSETAAATALLPAMPKSGTLMTGKADWQEAPSKPCHSQTVVVATAAAVNVPHQASAIEVLQREQQYLKQLTICKVCFQKPVKDLFLPCGELVSCLDCSKLLTHCPSCQQKILATVTTYFG